MKKNKSIIMALFAMLSIMPMAVFAQTREITIEMHTPATGKWDWSQGTILVSINGKSQQTLFTGNQTVTATPKKLTFNAAVNDKVQVIWKAGTKAVDGQAFVYYSDAPAAGISDSSKLLGSVAVGKAKAGAGSFPFNTFADNALASFTVAAAGTPAAAAPSPAPTPAPASNSAQAQTPASYDTAFIDKLPLSQPVGQAAAYNDLKGKLIIASFGRVACGNCRYMASMAEKFVNDNGAGDKVRFLYFDIDQPLADVQTYQKSQAYKHISFYKTDNNTMWSLDRAFPLEQGNTLPFVWYIDASGKVAGTSKGNQVVAMENFIKSNQAAAASSTQQPSSSVSAAAPSMSGRADSDAKNWDIRSLDTAANADYLSGIEKDVILEMNKVRADPKKYAELYIKPMLQYFNGKNYSVPGQITIVTQEGAAAVNECITALGKAASAGILSPEKGLSLAAKDHVTDQSKTGQTGHTGSDKSTPQIRMNRHGGFGGTYSLGENIAYGETTGRNIVVGLLVDDGVPGRGHRENIMKQTFTQTGTAYGTHTQYRTSCTITYASGYKSK
ncbi:MAG: hypothetical protein LBH44_08600 [Treponema sp.]|nr:hypothetical protein [Treponema sp.]